MTIRFFSKSDTYREFSNFAPFPIDIDGTRWPSTEHYYQAQKFDDPDLQERIRAAKKPVVAKKLADKHRARIRGDWDQVKDAVMERAIRAKFTQHEPLRALLLGTAAETLQEAAPHDYYWGVGADGTGRNKLGQMLMALRAELRKGAPRDRAPLFTWLGQLVRIVVEKSAGQPRSLPMTWRATVLTLFPEMFPGALGVSLAGKALAEGKWALQTIDIRDFATDKHRSVDDTPAGGGAGMVMRADIAAAAIDAARNDAAPGTPTFYLSPRGTPLTQERAREFAQGPGVLLLCGRFEGIDQRVLEARNVEEISIGDYVLSGGELAAQVLIDACVRLLPGVAGNESSLAEESFASGLLEYPHYTRPREWEGRAIPEVLLSGDHEKIAAWRRAQAEKLTKARRPELFQRHRKDKP